MFTHLHTHTCHSNTRGFLDSTNQVEQLIQYTKELGQNGIAITDHDTISCHMIALDYMEKLKKEEPEKWDEYKLILGNEIYLCSRKEIEENKNYIFYHFILIAKDAIGHQQIRELSTRAWVDNSFTWVNIRTPTFYDNLFEVVESDRGHLIGSTACLGGLAGRFIIQEYLKSQEENRKPDYSPLETWIKRMDKCFGHGNFFLEIQPSVQEDQHIANDVLIDFSKKLDIPYIITTDGHYLKKEDREIHEAFLNSNEDSGKDRELGDFYATTYIMDEKEIHEYLDKWHGAETVQKGIDNTQLIYDMVEEYSLKHPLDIPYEPDDLSEPDEKLFKKYSGYIELLKPFYESPYAPDRHLVREIVNRIEKDYNELGNQETYDAINTCLNVIKTTSDKMDTRWSAYLLQTKNLINCCWDIGTLVGPSRGSGGGFILLYILGITQINPLREETKLYYWRFLHEYRASVLDIDVDIMGNKKEELIEYLKDKYGGNRRIMKVQTLLTVKAKNAISIAMRGLKYTPEEAQFLSSFIGQERGIQYTLKQVYYGDEENNLQPNKEFVNLIDTKYQDVWKVAQSIEGLVVGVGSHAGGVVLTPSDVCNYTALMKTSSGDIISQFDLHKLEENGQKANNVLTVYQQGCIT